MPGRPRRVRGLSSALFLLTALAAPQASAEEWAFLGARYQAMGGAGVAVADDGLASYWNPGGLAFVDPESQDFELPFSFSASIEGEGLKNADDIATFIDDQLFGGVLTKVQTGQALTTPELQDALALAVGRLPSLGENGEGFQTLPDLGLVLRKGRFVVNLRGNASLGIDPVFDTSRLALSSDIDAATQVANVVAAGADRSGQFTNLGSQSLADGIATGFAAWSQNQAEELVFQAEQVGLDTSASGVQSLVSRIAQDTGSLTAADLTQNGSGVRIRGLVTPEISVGYAHPLLGDRLGIGGNLRVIHGISTSRFIQFDDIKDGNDLVDELTHFDNRETSDRVSLDLGVLLRPNDRWRIGVVGRNLTSPSFAIQGPGSFQLKPQVRAGVAVNLLSNWTVAADLDLTQNESESVDGLRSRLLSVGSEFRIPMGEAYLALRAGAFTNLASQANNAPTLTAGVGFQLWRLRLDVAAATSSDFEQIEAGGSRLPSRFDLSGSLKWVSDF